ncbi:CMRF35-like molecule 5 [Hypanus sabinus]|uniref:CMRF35-like molecule 5 n=1 Tax=Hypanus sabinus TaxID=79690 RepID=UPI0028C4818E|nr:CMRF35-like molecule 5 [Hypanus sabinus]
MWVPILLIGLLPVSGALWAKRNVTGLVGRAITIDCHYEAKYLSHAKYWCRGWTDHCTVLVETNDQHRQRGRVSITDNPEQRIFTVTMENLQSADTGWYGCGVTDRSLEMKFYVYLQVFEFSGALWAEENVRGDVGRAITIDCYYKENYRSHTKYWCRGWTDQCTVLVETNGQHGRSGRVSITDNPEQGIFTVSMEDLHSEDTGWYGCGITTRHDPIFNVHLQVSNAEQTTTQSSGTVEKSENEEDHHGKRYTVPKTVLHVRDI